MGLEGNETADVIAKEGCGRPDPPVVTKGGIRALWKRLRADDRAVLGFGLGRAVRWGRRAVSRYVQARTGKGDLGVWRERLGT